MSKGRVSSNVRRVMAILGQESESVTEVSLTDIEPYRCGSFGMVFRARLFPSGEQVAIKKTKVDTNYKNRELNIMRRLDHTNIVKLKYFFTETDKKDKILCFILEYIPTTLYNLLYSVKKNVIPMLYVKLYAYQLFRGLAYLHSVGICHRDVKPNNLLLNPETGVLKICDFGSAKCLGKGKTSVYYICSRYYRAPELLFQSTEYTVMIDVWSAGCVLVELILGKPIFESEDHISQLVEIIKVLGTPSKEEIKHMNKSYAEFDYPHVNPIPWKKVFKDKAPPDFIDLVSHLLVYIPSSRLTPLQACAHKFFNKLREPGLKLINRKLPPLFDFSEHELKIQPNLNTILIPSHLKDSFYPNSNKSNNTIPASSSTATEKTLVPSDSQLKISKIS